MNENESYVVKEYTFGHTLINDTDFIKNSCFKDCLNNYFHNFIYECIYCIELTNITDNERNNLTICDISMNLYDINKKSEVARQKKFLFNQINKLTKNFHSLLRYTNISFI